MSTPYTRGAARADRILGSDKGETGAIRRSVTTGGGPTDPTGGTTTVTDYPCRVAAFPVAQRDIDGTFIKAGDWRVLVATGTTAEQAAAWEVEAPVVKGDFADIDVTTTDLLVCSQGVLTIIDPGRFAPAGTVTHYEMKARK